jgi:hypothetical protein
LEKEYQSSDMVKNNMHPANHLLQNNKIFRVIQVNKTGVIESISFSQLDCFLK